jgi:hypothetical protein
MFSSEMCKHVSSELDYKYIRLWPRRSLSGKEGDCDEEKIITKLCAEELRHNGGKGNRLKDEKPD